MFSFDMIFSPRMETVSMMMPRTMMVASRFQWMLFRVSIWIKDSPEIWQSMPVQHMSVVARIKEI